MRVRSHPSPAARRLAAAAAMGVAVAALLAADPMPQGVRPSPEANPPQAVMAQGTRGGGDRSAITPSTPDNKAVQDLLGRAADDMATPGRGRDLLTLVARGDRDRLAPAGAADWSDVDAAATAFAAAWQAKFGASFKLADKVPVVFTEPAVHVTGLEAPPARPSTDPMVPPSTAPAARRTTATVVLTDPGHHGSVALKLANEGADNPVWRFDLPDTATAATLHDSLLRRLTRITADQQAWPTDVDQAYVFATQHLLASVADAGTPR